MKLLLTKSYVLFFILAPIFSFSQSFIDIADSVRLSRGVPGLVYAVFKSDSILDQGACGYRKYKTKDSIRIDDRFDIGYNTAAFTSYIAGKLVEAGKIKWDTKLLDVFPEYKKKAFPVYQNLTLSDLLSNQTVVPLLTTLDDLSHVPTIDGPTMSNRRRQFTLYILQQKPNMDNALSKKKPMFSIAAYVMAASMMEKVSGKKWEGLVNEYLNKALDISIKYGWPNLNDASQPTGHWAVGGFFHPEDADTWFRPNVILYPAHHINITLHDYIKFMQENLKGLAGQKAHISQKTLEYIHYGILDYSMGWYNGSLNNFTYSFHEGIGFLFDCRVSIIKEKNIGIIVMCNSGDKDGRGAVLNLSRILENYYVNSEP